jgi:hypothetical protein
MSIIPNLVDIETLNSVVCNRNNINLANISTIQTNNITIFLQKNWLLVIIFSSVIALLIYYYYFRKQPSKEQFNEPIKENYKQKKSKKVKIEESYDSCPNCGNKNDLGEFKGKMSEIEKPINHLEYEKQIKYPQIEHYNDDDTNESQVHHKEQRSQQMYNAPIEQTYESSYHNQYYGQLITDESQDINRNDIETFNSNSIGNYVSF